MERKRVRRDAFESMWRFLQFGQKANIAALKESCALLQKAMLQKTAGQRKEHREDVSFDEIDAIMNGVVIEAMALYLSGELDKIERGDEHETD